jgi:two-component system response regulator ResD
MRPMRYKILVVDDEPDVCDLLRAALERENFRVVTSAPERAVDEAAQMRPDVVLSDVCMPGLSGLALCRRLRTDTRTSSTPVVLISGLRKQELEQVEGLDVGADDYLLKPFSTELLVARLRAVLRRAECRPQTGPLKNGSLKLDLAARRALVGGREVRLTRKEFDLLAALLASRGRVLSPPHLLETIWGYDSTVYRDAHTVEVHVSALRRKLGPAAARRLVTVPGVGYRFDLETSHERVHPA